MISLLFSDVHENLCLLIHCFEANGRAFTTVEPLAIIWPYVLCSARILQVLFPSSARAAKCLHTSGPLPRLNVLRLV